MGSNLQRAVFDANRGCIVDEKINSLWNNYSQYFVCTCHNNIICDIKHYIRNNEILSRRHWRTVDRLVERRLRPLTKQKQYFRMKEQYFDLGNDPTSLAYLALIKRHSMWRGLMLQGETPSESFAVVNQQWTRVSKIDTSCCEQKLAQMAEFLDNELNTKSHEYDPRSEYEREKFVVSQRVQREWNNQYSINFSISDINSDRSILIRRNMI